MNVTILLFSKSSSELINKSIHNQAQTPTIMTHNQKILVEVLRRKKALVVFLVLIKVLLQAAIAYGKEPQ